MKARHLDQNLEWLLLLLGIIILLFVLVLDTQAQSQFTFLRQNQPPTEKADYSTTRHAQFKGRIVQIDAERSRLTVKHDPVPELEMETMTMPFLVKDRDSLTVLKVGDVITATIYEERESGRMWLENVTCEEAPAKNNKGKSTRKKTNQRQ